MFTVLKSAGAIGYFGVVTLLATEALVMGLLYFLLPQNEGWVVLAALIILPIWAALITSVFFIERRWRYSVFLLLLATLILIPLAR